MLTKEQLYQIEFESFVSLDLETTGLSPENCEIIEIGAFKFEFGECTDSFSMFINPRQNIPKFITELTTITNEDVKDAPYIETVLEDFLLFVGNLPIVGHNIEFDMSFMEYAFRKKHNNFEKWYSTYRKDYLYLKNLKYDTGPLARTLYPQLASFKLSSLTKHFNIEQPIAHRAADDSKATGELFLLLTEEICFRPIEPLQLIVAILKDTKYDMRIFFENILKAKLQGFLNDNRSLISQFDSKSNKIGKSDKSIQIKTAIDETMISNFFKEKGLISNRLPTFEARKEQNDLAVKIANVFKDREFLVSEAGTGTGKSLAYLVPAILHSIKNKENNGKVIISTNTKNLQEQLFYKDIPFLQGIIPENFFAVLLKGKTNYLCKDKWVRYTSLELNQLRDYEKMALLPLIYWSLTTQTGDIAENNAFRVEQNGALWLKMVAENNYCSGRKCTYYSNCHLIDIRNAARDADIVVVNHSLLFANLLNENSILGEFKHLVLDEAHNIERVATDYLGSEFSIWQCRRLSQGLYIKGKRPRGLLVDLQRRLDFARNNLDETIAEQIDVLIERLIEAISEFNDQFHLFFDEVSLHVKSKQSSPEGLLNKIRYHDGVDFFKPLNSIDKLKSVMEKVDENLFDLVNIFQDVPIDTLQMQLQMEQELRSKSSDIILMSSSLDTLLSGGNNNYVYWLEPPTGKDQNDTKLVMAPIVIDDLLNSYLYKNLDTAIFSSATLAVDKKFNYFNQRVGLDHFEQDRLRTLNVGSPFNFDTQAKLSLIRFLPDPGMQQYSIDLASFIRKVIAQKRMEFSYYLHPIR